MTRQAAPARGLRELQGSLARPDRAAVIATRRLGRARDVETPQRARRARTAISSP